MPRLNDSTQLFKSISTLEVFRLATATPGDTITTAALAAAAPSVSVSATTSFASADPVFIIGDGGVELNACGTPALAMPLKYKAAFAQSTGARFVEAIGVNLGYLSEAGATFSPSQSLTAILSANSATPLNYITGSAELSATFELLAFSGLNLHTMLGITEAETGVGTAADPYQYVVGGANIGTQGTQCFRLTGVLHSLQNFHLDFLNARIEVGGQMTFNRSAPAVYPVTIKFTNMVKRQWT